MPKADIEKKNGKRQKAKDLVIGGVVYPTLENLAPEVGKPVAVLRAWASRAVNPMPTIRPPSADPERRGQIQYANTPLLPAWLASFAQNPPRKPRRKA